MYEFLEGEVVRRSAARVVLDVGGVGYDLLVPLGSALPAAGQKTRLWVHLVVREDAHTLYGFADRDTRELFRTLLRVRGVGPAMGLAMLGGAVLVLDLRLLGLGLVSRSAAYVQRQSNPWLLGAIAVMLATGIPLFLSEAIKCYFRPAFWVKMGALVVALERSRMRTEIDMSLAFKGLTRPSPWR